MRHTHWRFELVRDPVELLLAQLVRRGLSGGSFGSEVSVAVGCSSRNGSSDTIVEDGFEVVGTRCTRYTSECAPILVTGCHLEVGFHGTITVGDSFEYSRESQTCVGRVPAGLESRSSATHRDAFGDHLAHCAHLEAASVFAFERLARELAAHGAPEALVHGALRSAQDEVRHARVMALLARSHHGEPGEARVRPLELRSLEEVARENAVEGCVNETYGALIGAYQAERAADLAFAQVMSAIAEDEARHAALSQRVHRWAMRQLDASARERVLAAQRRAVEALLESAREEPDPAIALQAGLPSAALAHAFARELAGELWMARSEDIAAA